MKKLVILLSIAVSVLLFTGCSNNVFKNTVEGTGEIVAKQENLENKSYKVRIADIETKDDGHVTFETFLGDYEPKLVIKTNQNILDEIKISVENNEIKIAGDAFHRYVSKEISISLYNVSVSYVNISGGVYMTNAKNSLSKDFEIRISGYLKADFDLENVDKFNINISGAGDIKASNCDLEEYYAKVSGAGDLNVSGKAKKATIQISGASNQDLKNFICEEMEINISGAAELDVNVLNKLVIEVSGTGNISQYGNADGEKRVSGALDYQKK